MVSASLFRRYAGPADHGGVPAFVSISPAREHEVKKARSLSLPKGSIVVEDMGYSDYAWYAQLTTQKIFFVTRQKRNARYAVLEHRKVNKTLSNKQRFESRRISSKSINFKILFIFS